MASQTEFDAFNTKTEVFISWLRQRSGATINPKIQIADLREIGAGRGIGVLEKHSFVLIVPSDLSL